MAGTGRVSVPEVVANRARAAGAQWWLDDVDDLVASLVSDWGLRPNGTGYEGGTEALVLPVTSEEFGPAVLKLGVPHPSSSLAEEATVLGLVAGDGCATLYRDDLDRGALLVEQLGPSLHDLGLPIEDRHRILATTAARVWRTVPDSVTLPTGAEKAAWLADYIPATWEELDRPCSAAAVEHALRCADRRRGAHDPDTAVLVHGDVQEWNTLRTLDGGDHKLIDPDGLIADAEYDLGVILRESLSTRLSSWPSLIRSTWLTASPQRHRGTPTSPSIPRPSGNGLLSSGCRPA